MSGPSYVAVILCAGASRRWGASAPKALAPIGGAPALERIARVAREGGCSAVLAVTGAGGKAIAERGIPGLDDLVAHPDWERGRTSSVRAGLRRLPARAGALIWPVDVPFVEAATVNTLIEAARRERVAIWITPTFDGHGGHPIVLGPEAVGRTLDLSDSVPLRDAPFRRGLGERRVPVPDPGVLDNTNTPEEFRLAEDRWRSRGGR